MAGIRKSGTRSLAPTSGVVQTPRTTFISQNDNGSTIIVSSSTNIAGWLRVVSTGTSSFVTIQNNNHNVGNVSNPLGNDPISPIDQTLFSNTAERKLAGAYFSGGVGIEKDLAVGGFIYGRIAAANTATTATNISIIKTNANENYYPLFTDAEGLVIQGAQLYGDDLNQDSNLGGLLYNPYTGKLTTERIHVVSTDTTTATVIVDASIEVGVSIIPQADNTGTLGTEELSWRDSYITNVYTRFLGNTNSNITLSPANGTGIADIFGDIRVRGNNPIGTAPVVTNTLYVTMDGDDTNDGRALDAGRACRTIGGAMRSPYYQPGTQILVSPGRYLENNPLEMKPYTSVRGSDIRTTFIEPINKTQDLFHMNSGCYLNYMNFINGRSGRLPGQYDQRFNRGAYATCFPPQTGNNRIDLFQSPYVQNCTNQSGPWLADGTMFVPNQTVQVPKAVGVGSWEANTASITVQVEQGTISIGQSINPGKQNQGFFNARTLLLANKPFIQSQTVAWVHANYPTFVYNEQLCFRDAGILVENMAYDMAFGGNEKSIESGKAYYRGVTSVIAGQETQTVGAIEYIKSLCQQIVQNDVCSVLSPPVNIPVNTQVINTALTGGDITVDSISNLFDIVTTIINDGPDAAPSPYVGTGPDAAFVSAEILMQANRSFMQENILNYINYFLCDPPKELPYNQIKCKRDAGIILDSVASDLLFPTPTNSQSTFAGIQYFTQGGYTGSIPSEITATIAAITYLRDLSIKIVQNVTPDIDAIAGISRYSNGVQTTASNYATANEVDILKSEFSNILTILKGKTTGWTDLIVPNGGTISQLPSVKNTYDLLLANTTYLAIEIVAYVNATFPSLSYNQSTCERDVGYILDSVAFDLLYGGNRQSIQSGLSYYVSQAGTTVIPNETTATVDAFSFMSFVIEKLVNGEGYTPLQTFVKPTLDLPLGDGAAYTQVSHIFTTITNIISQGPSIVGPLKPISLDQATDTNIVNTYNIIEANKDFIVAEMISHIDQRYNPTSFNYNQELCYRDVGLIIDAVSQDILLGGNQKSREAGLSYWNQAYNYVSGQITTTTNAINYVRDMALQIIANTTVTSVTGTVATQVINPFFQYGGDYMPQESVIRNFNIITDIIENGPAAAPAIYAGGGLFSLTGLHPDDVKIAPKVTSVDQVSTGVYRIGLDKPTVGFGQNSTLYFGDTLVYPMQNAQVEAKSLEYTGDATSWNERKVDPFGSMGGSLVDGGVISDRSPIQSFVYDAYTQLNQGGIGIKVTNNGYAQLVSVFTIFCAVGVQTDNGGIASITNSNCNFGDISLLAKGYGKREFSGTVFNPSFRAYPFSPNGPGLPYLDQFYPDGYWPNQGGRVELFVPDTANRPHIGLVMEVEPPEGHVNEQNFSGFLNAQPSTSTLTTGTINLTSLSTNDVFIGNTVYVRDQFGRQWDDNGVWYAATGTVVTDVNFDSISLNQALTSGGGDPTNPTYFTLYFCGNSYYTVQTSTVADQPYAPNANILSANSDPRYQGPTTSQISAHISSIAHMQSVVDKVIQNQVVGVTVGNTATQVINNSVGGGVNAKPFIDLRFGYITDIVGAANITAANAVVPQSQITTSGTVPNGAGSAVILIESNIDFIAQEVAAYVDHNLLGGIGSYNKDKCVRDVKLILRQIIYDLQSGGNYNSVYSGLSYWSRPGSYHIVELGEAVTRPDLFPDGSIVNFYQRSYISASGYLFEYVGAGSNYGALPQRGVADPVQARETVQLNAGKVFFTSTDQNGDFRIGPGLVISQATGVLSGRTFVQSLYANMTPFILAIE
jgi:hypothetical protein